MASRSIPSFSSSATNLPLNMTRTRSHRVVSSSISAVIRTTLTPSAAMARISWRISALEPASMPMIGSSMMNTRGLVPSHLANSTFC